MVGGSLFSYVLWVWFLESHAFYYCGSKAEGVCNSELGRVLVNFGFVVIFTGRKRVMFVLVCNAQFE